jgi:drug/metabolite transporter (DMT)-like permease
MPGAPAAAVPLFLLEAGLVVAWSSGFIGSRLAADAPSAFLVFFWRFAILTVLLAPAIFAAWRGALAWRSIRLQALIGALAMFGYLALGVTAIDLGVPTGIAALIAALQPVVTAALAGPILRDTVARRQWLGVAIGFAGVALAVGGSLGDASLWAYGLAFASMASIVAGTLLAKAVADSTPLFPVLWIQSAVSALGFALLSMLDGGVAPPVDTGSWFAVAWMVILPTFGGFGLYWLCLRRTNATRIGSLINLTPPVTMIWAWAMFGEVLGLAAISGFALCLVGVSLTRERVPVPARP